MKKIQMTNLSSFFAGVLVMWVLSYFFYNSNYYYNLNWLIALEKHNKQIEEVRWYTPELVYSKFEKKWKIFTGSTKIKFSDWLVDYKDLYDLSYFRVIDKKYVKEFKDNSFWNIENQLDFYFNPYLLESDKKYVKYSNKCLFEEELKKHTDKNFTILNIWNKQQFSWVVDFDSKVTNEEKLKIEESILNDMWKKNTTYEKNLRVNYNYVLLPKYFNDEWMKNHYKWFPKINLN